MHAEHEGEAITSGTRYQVVAQVASLISISAFVRPQHHALVGV
jgi:hypothetical protein